MEMKGAASMKSSSPPVAKNKKIVESVILNVNAKSSLLSGHKEQ